MTNQSRFFFLRNTRGYSLVELMVSLTILLLISGGGIMGYRYMKTKQSASQKSLQLDELRWLIRSQFDCHATFGIDLASDLKKLPCDETIYDLKGEDGKNLPVHSGALGWKARGFCQKKRFFIQCAN